MEGARLGEMEKKQKLRYHQISSRITTASLMALAAITMAVNRENKDYGSVKMEVNYSTISAFRFFVGGNAMIGAYSLISLISFSSSNARMSLVYVLDLMAMSLAMAVAASASAIAHVGKYGEPNAGWSPVCGYFPHFCHQTGFSLVLSFLGFISCFLSTAALPIAMAAAPM